MTEKLYSITDLAKAYEVTSRTIRHYEDKSLLCPMRRGTQRLYTRSDYVRLGLILRGKRIGFSLDEIKEILEMYDLPEGEQRQTDFLIGKINERRESLKAQQLDIEKMLSELNEIEQKLSS